MRYLSFLAFVLWPLCAGAAPEPQPAVPDKNSPQIHVVCTEVWQLQEIVSAQMANPKKVDELLYKFYAQRDKDGDRACTWGALKKSARVRDDEEGAKILTILTIEGTLYTAYAVPISDETSQDWLLRFVPLFPPAVLTIPPGKNDSRLELRPPPGGLFVFIAPSDRRCSLEILFRLLGA